MKYLYYLIIILTVFSCKDDKEVVTVSHATQFFNIVEVEDALEIYLEEDSVCMIEIQALEDVVNQIKFDIVDSVLSITDKRKNKWLTPENNRVCVYIKSPPLKNLQVAEGCKTQTLTPITSEEFGIIFGGRMNEADIELNCNTFYYWNNHPCGGRLTLNGHTNELKIWNYALTSVDAENLIANHALVENGSKGFCKINVLQSLKYSITGTGDIFLSGNPSTIIANELSSSGRLILVE